MVEAAVPMRVGEEPPPVETPAATPPPSSHSRPTSQSGNRFAVINAFVDQSLRELKGAEGVIWLILWRDTRAGVARVSQNSLALRAGVTSRTVRRALQVLQALGLVEVVRTGALGAGPSTYRIHPLIDWTIEG